MQKKLQPNDKCWCGSEQKYKMCHAQIDQKIQYYKQLGHIVPQQALLKTKQQIEGIRKSSKINIAVLDTIKDKIKAGMSTEEVDEIAADVTKKMGGIPAPLGYHGFPKSVCTSINSQICHGIPSKTDILKEGDIINVDASTIYQGYYSDSSRMFCIGEVKEETKQLVTVAKECIERALEVTKPWNFLGDIGQAVQDHAKEHGYSVVREIGGHGIGLEFHEEPFVSFVTTKGTEMLLVPGMVFTIEPMINAGSCYVQMDESNGWTVYTADGRMSAQWEVTVAVTEDGYEILTY